MSNSISLSPKRSEKDQEDYDEGFDTEQINSPAKSNDELFGGVQVKNLQTLDEICKSNFEFLVDEVRSGFTTWLKKTSGAMLSDLKCIKTIREKTLREIAEEKRKLEYEKEDYSQIVEREGLRLQNEEVELAKRIKDEKRDFYAKMHAERLKFEQRCEEITRMLAFQKENLNEQISSLQAEKNKIADLKLAAEVKVEVNVGGVIFETSRSTLIQQKGSFLESVFSGKYELPRDKAGRIFFDRDSEAFRVILNYLRNPTSIPCPRDSYESDLLAKESQYYGTRFFENKMIFLMGGHDGNIILNSIEALEAGKNKWSQYRPMPTKRTAFAGAVQLNKIYVYGGQNLEDMAMDSSEAYDILRDSWFNVPKMNKQRRNVTGDIYNGCIYAIGGYDGKSILSTVEFYDPRTNGWQYTGSMNLPRSSAICGVLRDQLYVFGGSSGTRTRTGERYEDRMNKWIELDCSMLDIRSAACSTVINEHLCVFGGVGNNCEPRQSVELFNSITKEWTYGNAISEPRMDACTTRMDEVAVICGGQGSSVMNTTCFYQPATNVVSEGPSFNIPRYGARVFSVDL